MTTKADLFRQHCPSRKQKHGPLNDGNMRNLVTFASQSCGGGRASISPEPLTRQVYIISSSAYIHYLGARCAPRDGRLPPCSPAPPSTSGSKGQKETPSRTARGAGHTSRYNESDSSSVPLVSHMKQTQRHTHLHAHTARGPPLPVASRTQERRQLLQELLISLVEPVYLRTIDVDYEETPPVSSMFVTGGPGPCATPSVFARPEMVRPAATRDPPILQSSAPRKRGRNVYLPWRLPVRRGRGRSVCVWGGGGGKIPEGKKDTQKNTKRRQMDYSLIPTTLVSACPSAGLSTSTVMGTTISLLDTPSHAMWPGKASTSGTSCVCRVAAAVPHTPRP